MDTVRQRPDNLEDIDSETESLRRVLNSIGSQQRKTLGQKRYHLTRLLKRDFWMMLMVGLELSLPRMLCMVWRLRESETEASGDCHGYLVLRGWIGQ